MPCRRHNEGFTLVELLVAMAVLVIMVAMVMQLFSVSTATVSVSHKHIDADETARLILDRIGSDFDAMVRRPDVNYIFCKNGVPGASGSSDAMFFYAASPGYLDPGATLTVTGNASANTLVGYRIGTNNPYYPGIPVMERLAESLTWGGAPDASGTNPGAMVFLTNPLKALSTLAGNWTYTLGSPPYGTETDTTHYQVLSDLAFRMEFCFLVKSGTYALSGTSVVTGSTGYSNTPTAIPSAIPRPYVTSNYFAGEAPPDLQGNVYGLPPDLGGIVVTIAVLDRNSRKLISGTGMTALAGALPDSLPGSTAPGAVEANPQLTSQAWQSKLSQPGLAQSLSIPTTALQQVRVYERTYYLDAN